MAKRMPKQTRTSRRVFFSQSLFCDHRSCSIAKRSVFPRYIQRLDDALSRPLDPHVTSAPREASVWTGTLVIPTLQADVLQAWLSSNPARQEAQRKEGGQQSKKIDPERESLSSLVMGFRRRTVTILI